MDARREQISEERRKKRAEHLNHVFIDNVRAGIINGVIECLDKGVDINIFNGNALETAAHYCDATLLELLLQRGATVGVTSALCQALEAHADIDIIKLLLFYKANPFANEAQAFQQAIKSGETAAVMLFTDSEEAIQKTLKHISLLLAVADENKQTEIQQLLRNILKMQNELNHALYEAVRDKYHIAAAECLQQGADKHYTDALGNTMMHYAAMNDDAEMLKLLDTPYLYLDKQNNKGHTVAYTAAKNGAMNALTYLFARRNVDVALTSYKNKNTPLIIAAKKGHIEVVSAFIKRGVKDTKYNAKQHNALHTATVNSHIPMMQLLVSAQPLSTNINARYVYLLSIATDANQPQALAFLLDRINYFSVTIDAPILPLAYCVKNTKLHEEVAMVYVTHFASKANEANISTIISDLARYEVQSTFLVSRFILAILNTPEVFTPKFKENYMTEIKKISFKQRDLIKNELYRMTNTMVDTNARDKLCKLACDETESNPLSAFVRLSKTFRCSETKGTLAKFSVLEERTRVERSETLKSLANTLASAIRTNNPEARATCLQVLVELFNDTNDSAVVDIIKKIDAQIPGYQLHEEFNRLLTTNVPPLYPSLSSIEKPSGPPPPYHSLKHH